VSISKDPRRSKTADDEAYLIRIGDRVRATRDKLDMTRKALSQASGVSERYLADLEAGSGNASLIVLRRVAAALQLDMEALLAERTEHPPELASLINRLALLSSAEIINATHTLARSLTQAATGPAHRIALVGLRGAGKSTLGRALAQKLALPFVELDREIERAAGMELSEIFALHGKDAYRRHELRCLEAIIDQHAEAVIATGGGLVTATAAYDLLLATCRVIWLKAAPESHMARVMAQGDLRPITGHPEAMDDLRGILESRAPLYARAHLTLETTNTSHEDAVATLLAAVSGSNQAAK
jgi:XRE family transcriptional regulator, aerobic/anaerobic benzoate catabolism transcriptional regulator